MDMDQACLKGMDSPPQSAEEKSSKDAAQKAKGPRKRTKTGCLSESSFHIYKHLYIYIY